MRILYVCADPHVSPHGADGEAAHVRAVTAALTSRGHSVTLACRRTDGPNPLARGVSVQMMPEGWQEQARWLVDQMRRLGIDAVIERMSLRSGPLIDATQRWPIPVMLHVTAPLVEEAARQDALDDVEDWRRWEARLLAAADHVVAVSEVVAWHVLGRGVRPDRVSVVANGVDPMRFAGVQGHSVRLEFDLRSNFVVGWRGELDDAHALDDVVDALAMLPDSVRLLVIGQGPELPALRARVHDAGMADRVAFADEVLEAEVPAFLAACDAAVAPRAALDRLYRSPMELLEVLRGRAAGGGHRPGGRRVARRLRAAGAAVGSRRSRRGHRPAGRRPPAARAPGPRGAHARLAAHLGPGGGADGTAGGGGALRLAGRADLRLSPIAA